MPKPYRLSSVVLATSVMIAPVTGAQAPTGGTEQPATSQQQPVLTTQAVVKPAGKAGEIATAEDLLTALETADQKIEHLEADLTHINRQSELVGNEATIKRGKLYFENTKATGGPRRFQVDFGEIEFNNQRNKDEQTFVFDGRWLVDRHPKDLQQFKYELCPPGKTTDPLAIGEGPFPIPIGQQKQRILDRFTCELVPGVRDFPVPPGVANFTPPQWATESYQLLLKPKAGTREARDFGSVRIWYRQKDLLPQMAKTMKTDDTSDEVILRNMVVNGTLPKGLFDTSKPEGWKEQVEPFKAAEGEQPAPAADK